MDRLEVEVALGHQCRDGVGARGTDSGGEILEGYRLEARLTGIVRHQFGAISCDGRLALRIQVCLPQCCDFIRLLVWTAPDGIDVPE